MGARADFTREQILNRGAPEFILRAILEVLPMPNVKTAISVQEGLFEKAEEWARRLNVSRSRLFVLALEDYIRKQENRELLDRVNAAYTENPDESEAVLRRKSRPQHKRMVEGEW
jgi:hypothetical protein